MKEGNDEYQLQASVPTQVTVAANGSELPISPMNCLDCTGAASQEVIPRSSQEQPLVMTNDMREQKAIPLATKWTQLCSAVHFPELHVAFG